jgi:hypothetical protein
MPIFVLVVFFISGAGAPQASARFVPGADLCLVELAKTKAEIEADPVASTMDYTIKCIDTGLFPAGSKGA